MTHTAEPTARTAELSRLLDLPAEPRLRSLRGRFVRAIAMLMALVLTALTIVLVLLGRAYNEGELLLRARGYATLAAPDVAGAWERYGQSGAAKFRRILFDTSRLNDDLYALAIYDTNGDELFHTDSLTHDPRVTPFRALGPELRGRPLPVVPDHEVRVWTQTDAGGERYFVVLAPYIDEWDGFRFAVAFYFTDDRLDLATYRIVGALAGLGLLALLLGIGCAFVLARESLEPLEELTRGAGKLAIGLLDHRVDLTTGDEFEILSQALDQMAQRLQSTIADLEGSNEHLLALNQQLQELDRVKGDLLANVSHELRTPLTAIAGYVEALRDGLLGEVHPDQERAMMVMDRNILRLRGMIDQLLNYSRMESGSLELELRPFDLAPVAEHVIEALRAIHGDSHDLVVRMPVVGMPVVGMPEDLPRVYGDAARIAQVLENLLTNAIKFTPEKGRVEVSAREVDDGVEVCVSDTGIGIPPEARDRIFDRFFQIDASARRRFGGIGLGLAIVREILERHHSEITLDSEVGVGTTFRFVLPAAAERTGLVALPGARRIALIDDDSSFVQEVASHLSRNGFSVETAATAKEGERLVRRIAPDVVLIDRILPDEDGFDVLARLREDPTTAAIPVIVVSRRKDRALAKRLGTRDYLVKPVTPEQVEKALDRILSREPMPGSPSGGLPNDA